ncbi:MAG: hypothetical protein Q4D26_09165 [Clostridia bacterium]|nr:hypothetical protein [Clostridia bacterium]
MKRLIFVLSLALTTLLLSVSTLAAEKTDAYNRLMNTIVSKEEIKEMGWYALTDVNGNIWRADFAENGNIVCFSTQIDDYGEAHSLAYKLVGDNLEGVKPYTIPFTRNLEEPLTNEIVVPVYKDISVDIICARPAYLYPSCEKLIDSFSLDSSKGAEIIMFYTKATASFKATITSGGLTDDHLWGQDWFSEEEAADMEAYQASISNTIEHYQFTEPIPEYSEEQYQQNLDLYTYRGFAESDAINNALKNMQPPSNAEYGEISNGEGFFP